MHSVENSWLPVVSPSKNRIDRRERVGDNFSDPASIDVGINFNDNAPPECRSERNSVMILYLPRDFIAANCRYVSTLRLIERSLVVSKYISYHRTMQLHSIRFINNLYGDEKVCENRYQTLGVAFSFSRFIIIPFT